MSKEPDWPTTWPTNSVFPSTWSPFAGRVPLPLAYPSFVEETTWPVNALSSGVLLFVSLQRDKDGERFPLSDPVVDHRTTIASRLLDRKYVDLKTLFGRMQDKDIE